MQTGFGAALKHWRMTRRMSQMDLALEADVSARHVSFLETGRAKPSSQMVLQLAKTLNVPRGERNHMLAAAGYADRYRARNITDAELAPVHAALRRMIDLHDPLPAFALNRHWIVIAANQGFLSMAAGFGMRLGDSMLDALFGLKTPQDLIANWPEFGYHILSRLRTENAHLGGDPVLQSAVERLAADPDIVGFQHESILPAMIATRLKQGEQTLSFLSTIAQFGSTEDIILADLKIEMMFPADAQTAALYGVDLS